MDLVFRIHAALANTMAIFFIACAIWAIVTYLRRQRLSSSFWGMMFLGWGCFIGQMLLGIFLVVSGVRPGQVVHFLYGAVGAVVPPLAMSYARSNPERETLVMTVLSLFLFGVAVRAIMSALSN